MSRKSTWKYIVTTFDNIQQLVENEEVELLNYATQMHTMDILSRPLSLDNFLEFEDKPLHSKIVIYFNLLAIAVLFIQIFMSKT